MLANKLIESKSKFGSYLEEIEHDLLTHKKHNKKTIEKLASSYGIYNKNLVKETTELAIVNVARSLANQNKSDYNKFLDIVELYKNQVNLSHRTSQSMLLQQYSTPAPISYIASLYIKANKNANYFEPSAGNGLLTIALPMQNTIVNEIDDIRLANLRTQNFKRVTNQNALIPFTEYHKKFDGVLTNPPFGTLLETEIEYYDGFKIKTLDHLMSLRALDTMKDDGKASIIIGGHTAWDSKGRIQAGKNRLFFNYLYSHYNIEDVILIDGHKLYSRQGTAFNTRLILINGRKQKVEGYAPLKNNELATVVSDFKSLWIRTFLETQYKKEKKTTSSEEINLFIEKQKRIRIVKSKAQAKIKLLKLINVNSLKGISDINKEFNSNLILFKQKKLNGYFRFFLGYPNKKLLKAGFKNNIIFLTATTLYKKLKTHNEIEVDNLKNLPQYLHNPIMILQSKTVKNAKVVLTEIKSSNNKNLILAIHLKQNSEGSYIQEIQSIYEKRIKSIFNWIVNDNLLLWADLKKTKNLLLYSDSNYLKSEQVLNFITKLQQND